MIAILRKEISGFFSSFIGYISIGVFLILLGLMMWVFPDYSILSYNYASLDQLFMIAPVIFMFLLPAITMRTFSEEHQAGTIEFLVTKPVTDLGIILGKYFASLVLLILTLLPTLIYVYSVYELGSPKGNIDLGQVAGSYIGLFFLGACFAAIGIFASTLSKNQIVAFVLACFLCFFAYWAFLYLSKLPVFSGKIDGLIEQLGIDYHYRSISKGVIDTRDILYFISFISIFILLTKGALNRQKK